MSQAAAEEWLKKQANPVIARFEIEAVHMDFKSRQAGRPIYEDREMVKIIIPGARGTEAWEVVTDEHRQRWPQEYAAFKAGLEQPVTGTPLREWPCAEMTPGRVKELAFLNILTVEHLAMVNDANVVHLGMGARALRDKARLYLSVAENQTAPIERLVTENERLAADNARLRADLDQLAAEVRAMRGEGSVAHVG